MSGIFVDSNVILDLFLDDPRWAQWSETTLEHYACHGRLYISPVVYSENGSRTWSRRLARPDSRWCRSPVKPCSWQARHS